VEFFGRNKELTLLDKLHQRAGSQFLILYGRRRIGKTSLIEQWTQSRLEERDYLYWMATQTSTTNQLRDFSQTILRFIEPDVPISPSFSYESWETALARVAQLSGQRRFVLILDEITYALQANPELPSLLQRAWDHALKGTNLFLILTGSLAGIIQRSALDYQSPLYGRATAKLKLQPLSFGTLRVLLPEMTTEERVAVYAITGGIPAYLELFDDTHNIIHNLREHFITPTNVMLNDAVFLLREQVDEPRNYIALLEAIANGGHKLADIAKLAGLERSNANKYLTVLRELGYIERIVPVTVQQPERSRRGRYVFTDAYLRFYFRFLRPYLGDIERGRFNRTINLLGDHLTDFIGTHTYEELCREWLNEKTDRGELPYFLDRVGSHWSKEAQIDVVGINWRTKQILFGECKWGRQPVERKVIDKLVAQSAKVLPSKSNWQQGYILFSRAPLTSAARLHASDLGAMVLSVEQLEADMYAWQE
jgi:AAA+ ATPase superfamily predicted ATPase